MSRWEPSETSSSKADHEQGPWGSMWLGRKAMGLSLRSAEPEVREDTFEWGKANRVERNRVGNWERERYLISPGRGDI